MKIPLKTPGNHFHYTFYFICVENAPAVLFACSYCLLLCVLKYRQSQVELRTQIENLSVELSVISQNQQSPIDLESYIKKLLDARKRITIVNSILQNAQVGFIIMRSYNNKEIIHLKKLLGSSEQNSSTFS